MSLNTIHNYDAKIKELQYQIASYEDTAAYKALFILLFPSLQNFAFSIIKSRLLAEETASDIMLAVWIQRKKLMEIENLKLYLFVSVKNAAIKKLKQEKRDVSFSIENMQVEFISDYANPGESTELNDLQHRVSGAVKKLPDSCQLIYKLAKEDRLKYKEIAHLLNLSIKTIDNQIAIAVKKIAAVIGFNTKKNKS